MNSVFHFNNNSLFNKINYSLGNTSEAKQLLFNKLLDLNDIYASNFKKDVRIGVYRFDFFCDEFNLAVNIDAISDNFDEFYNNDQIKSFSINQNSIRVLKVTDYQVLLDIDQITRCLKNKYLKTVLT